MLLGHFWCTIGIVQLHRFEAFKCHFVVKFDWKKIKWEILSKTIVNFEKIVYFCKCQWINDSGNQIALFFYKIWIVFCSVKWRAIKPPVMITRRKCLNLAPLTVYFSKFISNLLSSILSTFITQVVKLENTLKRWWIWEKFGELML